MNKKIRLGILLASTFLSSSVVAAFSPEKQRQIDQTVNFIKAQGIEQEAFRLISGVTGKNITSWEQLNDIYKAIPKDQRGKRLEELGAGLANTLITKVNEVFGKSFTSFEQFEELGRDIENGSLKLTPEQKKFTEKYGKLYEALIEYQDSSVLDFDSTIQDKLIAKEEEIFSQNPKLLAEMKKIREMTKSEYKEYTKSSEYKEYINSEEYSKVINSPDVQESLKKKKQNIEKKVDLYKKQGVSQQEINKYLKAVIANNKDLFADPETTKDSSKFTPLQKQDVGATDSLLASAAQVNLVESVIDNRLIQTGIAAGDEPLSYGMWVRGMFSQAKQSSYKLTPGYKLNQHGATIGFDLGEDDKRAGLAYSFVDSKVNGKNTGIKDKIKSHIATLYGLYQFPNNMFVDGQIRYGISNIKKTRDNGNLSGDKSSAKPKGKIFGGKVEIGYDYALENKIHLIPTIGISHDQLAIKGYSEKDGGFDRAVGKRTASKTSALAGLRVSTSVENQSFTMIPEIHTNLIYTMNSKNPKTTITLFEGMDPITTPSAKMPKTSYKIGGSVKFTKCQKVDLGVGYDLGLSKKFYSHSGYLNARYNF